MSDRVGLPITVGVARTKFLAKVASGVAKPDGLLVVPVFMALLHVGPSWALLWLPVVVAVQFLFMLGIAYVFAV